MTIKERIGKFVKGQKIKMAYNKAAEGEIKRKAQAAYFMEREKQTISLAQDKARMEKEVRLRKIRSQMFPAPRQVRYIPRKTGMKRINISDSISEAVNLVP